MLAELLFLSMWIVVARRLWRQSQGFVYITLRGIANACWEHVKGIWETVLYQPALHRPIYLTFAAIPLSGWFIFWFPAQLAKPAGKKK